MTLMNTRHYKIAWLPGDGVGIELAKLGKQVLSALDFSAEFIHGDIGWEFWKNEGNPLPDRTIDVLKNTDCAFMAAITSKPKSDAALELKPSLQGLGYEYTSPILQLRQQFHLHTNLRPCRAFLGNSNNHQDEINLVIFRENTEGLYAGVEFYPLPEPVYNVLNLHHKKMSRFDTHELDDVALSTRIMTRSGCRSIVRQAFEYSRNNNRKSVTLVDKPNILRETGGLMRNEAIAISKEYPEIEFQEVNMDAMCMWLVKNPKQYDVLVAENMFGDILSDLAAQLVGGLGFAGSANIGDEYAVFEPSHGSVPKYAGKNKVNPIATFLSLKMMLDWLEEKEKGQRLESAIANVIAEQKFGTYDMGMDHSSVELTEAICNFIDNFSVEKIS